MVSICSYTIYSCTVTNDFNIFGAHGGTVNKHTSGMRQTGNITSQASKQEYYLCMCVTDNKELVKKIMASANEITMGIVAPLH